MAILKHDKYDKAPTLMQTQIRAAIYSKLKSDDLKIISHLCH